MTIMPDIPSRAALLLACAVLSSPALTAGRLCAECRPLDGKARGEDLKHSVVAEVDGPLIFSDIGCAVTWRNVKLCAMEMVSFDNTSRVFDAVTGEEIEMTKSFFVLAENAGGESEILAFSSREAAEAYARQLGGGTVLDFTELTERY